jgi:DNA-binding transcriptional MerR regulator
MLIGEVARQAGVSRDTVRLYTRLGLVPCGERKAGSRAYADYNEDSVDLIKNIKFSQSIGFSLSELLPLAKAYVSGELDQDNQRAVMEAKLADIEERQRKFAQMAEFLRTKLGYPRPCELLDPVTDDPARVDPDDGPADLGGGVVRVGQRLGVAADLQAADPPRVDGGDVIDNERDLGSLGDVAELAAVGHVPAADVDGSQLVVVPEPDRVVLHGAVAPDRREPAKPLPAQVLEIGLGEHRRHGPRLRIPRSPRIGRRT